jgi:hypothetical protein
MSDLVAGLLLGWSLGFAGCWFYFHRSKLIRSRKEWMVAEALRGLYNETADYIRLNNLGDTHHNATMKAAKEALGLKD